MSGCDLAHASGPGAASISVRAIADDSRAVEPGALFIARPGVKQDGTAYALDAVRAGAAAVILPASAPIPSGMPQGVCVLTHADAAPWAMNLLTGRLAERFYGNPSSRLCVAGVTGTNGKTTTSVLLQWLLNSAERPGGSTRCGLISTVAIDAGPERTKAVMTTPGAVELSRSLAAMADAGRTHAVVETSSHALDQGRVAALRYRVGVFTNLSGDHLDYHKTMEAYAGAKARLFEMLPPDGVAVVNQDDPWSERMLRDCRARVIACTLGAPALSPGGGWARCRAAILGAGMGGMEASLEGPWGELRARIPLVGHHNAMNALQAVAAANALGVSRDALAAALERAPAPPGRLEPVTRVRPGVQGGTIRGSDRGEPFAVFVDYAHTDDALTRVMSALKPLVGRGGWLRVVFGCGGDRDRTKRPRMGAAVAALADEVVVTSDNPRTEDPMSIIAMVLEGIPEPIRRRAQVDPDREAAIRRTIMAAREGDIVLIAGKGHEDYQILPDGRGGTVTRHFDDREVARAALMERFGAGKEASR